MEKNLHILQVNEGIILDEIKLKGVREFRYVQDEGENIGTLSLKLDVRILKQGVMNLEGNYLCGRSGPDSKLPAAESPGTDQGWQMDIR